MEALLAIHLLTFNIAGLPFIHPHWQERLHAIARELKASRYDVVAVQEVWRDKDSRALEEEGGFPYAVRYRRRVEMGTGLLILSRWPILEKHEVHFTCRPSILRFPQGESVANKGALMARVQTPRGPLDVWTAHLISDYPDASYRTLRLTQLFEFAEAVQRLSAGRAAVVMGDYNMDPQDPEYGLFTDLLGVKNACAVNKGAPCGPTNATGRMIDHVFVPRAARKGLARVRAAFTQAVPGKDFPFSDHWAVEAVLGPEALALKLAPDPVPQAAALSSVEASLRAMMDQMMVRLRLRGWIPVYGFLMTLRYHHQLPQLADIRARVETTRLLAVGPR